MRRSSAVLLVVLALASCGGDGGDEPSIPISNDVTGLLRPGVAEYRTRYSGTFDDGRGPVNFELEGETISSAGDVRDLLFGDNLKAGFTTVQFTTSFVADGQPSTERITFAQAADRSIYILSFDDEDCRIDEATFDAVGAPLDSPGTYFVGFTYDQTFPMVCSGGEAATYTRRFSVLDIETVNTPIGSVEAFRVTYSVRTRRAVWLSPDEVDEASGTVWVHPDLGAVKVTGTSIDQDPSGLYSFDFDSAIKSSMSTSNLSKNNQTIGSMIALPTASRPLLLR